MYTDIPLSEGQCIDSNYIAQLFENLEFLNDCSKINTQQFVCKNIEETLTGPLSVSGSTLCFDLQSLSGLVNPNIGSDSEQKMLLFRDERLDNIAISDSDTATVRVDRQVSILCNGETVKTLSDQDFYSPISVVFFECPSNSDIQLCYDSQIRIVTGQTTSPRGTQSINLCASLVCITETDNDGADGYFMPPSISTECCYGREAIHLAIQNTSALRLAYADFGQIPSCTEYLFEDQDDHVLENTAPTTIDWLALGNLTICGENGSTGNSAVINARPVFTCGSTRINCVGDTLELAPAEDGSTTGCLTVPVLACGQCQPGESLAVSVRSQFECSEQASQVVEGIQSGITSVTQSYCVYKFRRLSTEFGDDLNGSIGKCIEYKTLESIKNNLDLIADVCENPSPINLTTRQVAGVAQAGSQVIIQDAQPWPPSEPLPRPIPDPPPVKKWFISGSILPCRDSLRGINEEELRRVSATATITCGGNVIASQSVTWQITGSGGFQLCGDPIQFNQCISCEIDQDLIMSFSSSQIFGFGTLPNQFTYDLKLFCF